MNLFSNQRFYQEGRKGKGDSGGEGIYCILEKTLLSISCCNDQIFAIQNK